MHSQGLKYQDRKYKAKEIGIQEPASIGVSLKGYNKSECILAKTPLGQKLHKMLSFTKQQVKEISEQLDCGFKAFYHKQTGELIFLPDFDRFMDMETEEWQNDLDKIEENFSDYHEIKAMESRDSFREMADFAEQLSDKKLQDQLVNALNKKKPFREFNFVLSYSGEKRQAWFDFKNKRYLEWVEEQIRIQNEIDEDSGTKKTD